VSGGPLLQIGEVSGERRIIALDGPRVVAECLRCGAIETPWRIAFRQSPGPCLACRVAARKAANLAHMASEIREVGGCPVIRLEPPHVVLACPCGAEFTIRVETARGGQTHTPRRCPACRRERRSNR